MLRDDHDQTTTSGAASKAAKQVLPDRYWGKSTSIANPGKQHASSRAGRAGPASRMGRILVAGTAAALALVTALPVGATGRVTGPHLHWQAQYGAVPFDPSDLLKLE